MKVLTKKFVEMVGCSAGCGAMLRAADPDEEAVVWRYGRTVGVFYELIADMPSASGNGRMRSNASILGALGIVEELKAQAKTEVDRFADVRRWGAVVVQLRGLNVVRRFESRMHLQRLKA